MVFSLAWSLGFLISILAFSIVIGLILNFNETSSNILVKYVIIPVIFTSIIIFLISSFKNQLFSAIGVYNYSILFLIAFILIFIGYLLSRGNNFGDDFNKVISLSYVCFILLATVCILSGSDILGLDSLWIALFTAVLFVLFVVVAFFTLKKFDSFGKSFKILRDFYFIFGVYFLIVSLFLPNIVSLNMDDMNPINIVSIEYMIFTFVFLIVVAVLGLWYYRKNTLFK